MPRHIIDTAAPGFCMAFHLSILFPLFMSTAALIFLSLWVIAILIRYKVRVSVDTARVIQGEDEAKEALSGCPSALPSIHP